MLIYEALISEGLIGIKFVHSLDFLNIKARFKNLWQKMVSGINF